MLHRKYVPALVLGLVGSVAQAAVPEAAAGVFTTLAADAATVLGYAFTAMIAVTGGWIVFGMVKKGAKRST